MLHALKIFTSTDTNKVSTRKTLHTNKEIQCEIMIYGYVCTQSSIHISNRSRYLNVKSLNIHGAKNKKVQVKIE